MGHPPNAQGRDRVELLGKLLIPRSQIPDSGRILTNLDPAPMRHLKEVRVLRSANPNGFQLTVAGFNIGHIMAAVQRSGAVVAVSGRKDDGDPIVIHAVTSGSMTFDGPRESHTVSAGNLIVRDSGRPWDLVCRAGSASHVITIPRALVRGPNLRSDQLKHAHIAEMTKPEVQLIFAYLKMLRTTDLLDSAAASTMAEAALASLFVSLVAGDPGHHPAEPGSTMSTAKIVIEKYLESEELSPTMVAGKLGISVRTLHRAFSRADCSVMSLIRRLRMERARKDLLSSDAADAVSRAAARWHFSDSSHFIRNFKSIHGITPKAYIREHLEDEN